MVLRFRVHDLITLKKTAFGRWQTDYALIRFPYFPHGRFQGLLEQVAFTPRALPLFLHTTFV